MAFRINIQAFRNFVQSTTAGGIILMVCVVFSLTIANSPLAEGFANMLKFEFGFENDYVQLRYNTLQWINDGLMAIFFLFVGLEIKRELIEGELSSIKKASLPVIAAFGGAILPAAIFAGINYGQSTASGWGIPMATDIAFAIAIISLLGKKVPASLKVFLAALAIVDDLIAILVIAIFYSSDLHTSYLLYAGGTFVLLILFNRLGLTNLLFYLIPGVFMWYFVHHSGIHATIAGVLIAITVPTNETSELSPLEKLEHWLSKPVNFLIMPLFALVNTNITFEAGMLQGLYSTMGLGIVLGLVLGKPIGITLTCWLAVKLRIGTLPDKAHWGHIVGLGLLAGIGFTMSIFVALLSYSTLAHQTEAKFSVLVASILAGVSGFLLLSMFNKRRKTGSAAQ